MATGLEGELVKMQVEKADRVLKAGTAAVVEETNTSWQQSGMDKLTEDCVLEILRHVTAPADIENARAVCKGWYFAVIEGDVWRLACEKLCPHLISLQSTTSGAHVNVAPDYAGPSRLCASDPEARAAEGKARVWRALAFLLAGSQPIPRGENVLFRAIHASSTDQVSENVEHTLFREPLYGNLPSYWSSRGSQDQLKEERLTYWLRGPVCVVHEVGVRPYKATFQEYAGSPIYSAKQVRFRFGYSTKGYRPPEVPASFSGVARQITPTCPLDYSEFVWHYTSPVFEMVQEDKLQRFSLPEPILVCGGVMQVELLGRVQIQDMDMRYYICVCHVCVQGKVLVPLTCDPAELTLSLAKASPRRYIHEPVVIDLADAGALWA